MNVHVTTYQFWLILICTLIPPIQAYGVVSLANTTQTHNRPISHLIVKFADSDQRSPTMIVQQNRTRITQNITGLNIQHQRSLPNGAMLMALPYNMTPEEAAIQVQYLSESDQIAYAEPDAWRRPFLTPNDTLYNPAQWHLKEATSYSGSANLPSAWNITTGDSSIIVAVVDTGSLNHTDLDSRFIGGSAITSGRDFVTDITMANDGDGRDNDPTDPGDKSDGTDCSASPRSSWHGTHVIGTIGAETDNAIGVAGIDWNAKLLTARALGVCGGALSDTTDAIRWSAGESIDGVTNPNPAKVINLSLGGDGTCSITEQNAIDAAVSSGAVVVVAAGNENTDVANVSPASCQNVITVAALEPNGARASFSNYGEEIDIAAPGVYVWSTLDSGNANANNDDAYAGYSGTSMATPHVSGVIALMLASNANLTNGSLSNVPSLIETKLKASARSFPTGTDLDCTTTTCGAGMLDAHQAVLAVSTAPSVNAGIDQSVAHGATVSLSATASDDAYSGAKTYQWGQTSGASITLQNTNASSTSFTAPATDETLVFQITVTDDTGLTATDTINVIVSSPDTTPDAFSFTDQTDVERSTPITSNAITVSGINSTTAISVSNGGEYRINNGGFTNTTGTVANSDTVQVRHTSSGSFSTTTDTVLTIGGVSDTFTSTTLAIDTTPDAFSFTDQTDVERSTPITSNAITVSGINSTTAISVSNGGEYRINNGGFTNTTGTVSNSDTVRGFTNTTGTVANSDTVQVRHTSSGSFSTTTDTVLTIGGVSDTFTSTTLAIDTTPDAFSFTDQTDVERSTPITSNAITVSGINSTTAISVSNGGEYRINNGGFTNTTGTVSNSDTVQVRHTSSDSFSTTTDTVLTIGGVSDTFTSTTLAIDTTPDAFSFTDQTDVERSTPITSNAITVSGINSAAAISVNNGEYRINNGSFTNTTGTVANGNTVQVRHTSSGSFSTATDTVLTIGGVSDTFTSTTLAIDTTPDAFSFTDQTDVGRSTTITSNAITVSGINSAAAISVNNGEYRINNGGFTNTTGTVANGDTVQVRHTSSGSFSTATDTVLTIGGVSDTFTSTTLAIDTTPDAFSFTDQTDVGRSTTITSNAITVSGINSAAAISVSNGEYRINNGGFTNTTGTVANGDTVQVRHTSSGSFSTTTDTVLTIGGVSDTFTSTTLPDDAGSADVVSSDGEKITIEAPDMALRDVETKTEDSVNTTNKPDDYQVVGEILSYKVKGIADGATVEITLTYPNALGSNSKIYKIGADGFSEFPNAVISGNTVTLTLVDGGSGDADGVANGVIEDPVAVMEPSNSTSDSSNGESGGGGSIDLLLLIMLLASVLTHYHWAKLSQMKTASN